MKLSTQTLVICRRPHSLDRSASSAYWSRHFHSWNVCSGSWLFSNSGLAVKLSVEFLSGSLFSSQ
jgi:hypothetical protein